jgi:hypothetical protein
MWKWFAGVIVLLVVAAGSTAYYLSDKLYLRYPHADVSAADFTREFPPGQLRADFQFMTRMIEHVHPDVAAITDAKDYAARKAAILAQLNHPMTRTEFARTIGTINEKYRDGHTGSWLPREEFERAKTQDRFVPLTVVIDANRIAIARGLSGLQIPSGSELVSLNGLAGSALAEACASRVSGETALYRRAFASESFAKLVWELGIRAPFRVAYRAPNDAHVATMDAGGVPFPSWAAAEGTSAATPFALSFDGNVAVLTLNDFNSRLQSRFHIFLGDAFASIRAHHARVVVLDMRRSDGGDTRLSDELQTYLSAQTLPAIRNVTTKATPEVKALYHTLLPPGFRWIPLNRVVPVLRGIDDAPDNGFYSFHPEGAAPSDRGTVNPLLYNGPVYILISPNTYSTSLIAVAPYNYWKRATIVGQPTGEGLTFFGDYYEFFLPNTKLTARASHKAFELVGSRGPSVPLMPDIATDAAHPDAYALAVADARKKHQLLP